MNSQHLQDLKTVADLVRTPYNRFKPFVSTYVTGNQALVGDTVVWRYSVPKGQALVLTRMSFSVSGTQDDSAGGVPVVKPVEPGLLMKFLYGYFGDLASNQNRIKTKTPLSTFDGSLLLLFEPNTEAIFSLLLGTLNPVNNAFALGIRFEGLLTLPEYLPQLKPMQTIIHSVT
jgi:hypothetical protein